MAKTVLILGAGFSSRAEMPTQSEFSEVLLSNDFSSNEGAIITRILKKYFSDIFGYHKGKNFPTLEDVFTGLDLSISQEHSLGIKYDTAMLRSIRRILIHRVFEILDLHYRDSEEISNLLRLFLPNGGQGHSVGFITTNWGTVLEKHLKKIPGKSVDYCLAQG